VAQKEIAFFIYTTKIAKQGPFFGAAFAVCGACLFDQEHAETSAGIEMQGNRVAKSIG
jgi:hypothetical protein